MIMKYCEYCHKIQPYDHQCERKPKQTTAVNHTDFYTTPMWVAKRELIKQKCFGLDIYDLIVNRVITYGRIVHHIIPLEDNKKLSLSDSNLILLSDSNHQLIHQMLKTNYISTIKLMRDCLITFEKLKSNKDFFF